MSPLLSESTDDDSNDDREVDLLFNSLEEFVRDYLVTTLPRPVEGRTAAWCPSWWDHAEAVMRLSTMWRSYEFLRLDPFLGLSNWILNHRDPHLRVLLDPVAGTFAACGEHGHQGNPQPPALEPAPAELMSHPAFALADEDDPFIV